MARNRIIYGSQSVWCNGEVLLRVQQLGSTTTFTSEDIFELGHMDIIDVVDDVPAVAVTLNTNNWGDLKTMAVLAQIPAAKRYMAVSADTNNANLAVVSGTTELSYLHGVALTDFAITCGALPGVTLWAPVQDECALGTYLTDDIDQTLFMDEVFVNRLELAFTTGANATENYAAETSQKMWLLNDGRFVSFESFSTAYSGGAGAYVTLGLGANRVTALSDGSLGFLRTDANGARAVTFYDVSASTATNYAVVSGTAATTATFVYNPANNRLYSPTDLVIDTGDSVEAIFCSTAYSTSMLNAYFRALQDLKDATVSGAAQRVDVGTLRQGQIEVYVLDPGSAAVGDTGDPSLANAWRLTGCTVTCDLTRTPLAELGHLSPYDRPVTVPIPITVTVDSTAGDLELWARFAKQRAAYAAGTLDDLNLADLMSSENLKLIVKVFAQTDEEAGGTGSNRRIATGSSLIGQDYFNDGAKGTYAAAGVQEYALKTIVVEHLKMTDEAYTLDMGANATQTYGFRSTNDLYVVKGDVGLTNLKYPRKIRRNA